MSFFFFFNDTATTEIYPLSLHDALPISRAITAAPMTLSTALCRPISSAWHSSRSPSVRDRKSTRLNSSHSQISYAVFCLKKKKNNQYDRPPPARSSLSPTSPDHASGSSD